MPKKTAKSSGKILVTGGAGYIGSHMVRLLLEHGYKPVVFDNLSTGHRSFVPAGVDFIKGDLRKPADIHKAFKKHKIEAVIHFAGVIVVPESVADPLKYYDNNVTGTILLLMAMADAGVDKIVFSSSACVYGEPRTMPVSEKVPFLDSNPYGMTKIMVENMLADLERAGKLSYVALRYFNVVGAHPAWKIGELHEPETHLVPNILRAVRKGSPVDLFGHDYDTKDGTCTRDYIHVLDLCVGHLSALKRLISGKKSGVYNLGTGRGVSVLEVIETVEKVTGLKVRYKMRSRRPGDPSALVANPSLARKDLGWRAELTLEDAVKSAWAWEKRLGSGSFA